MSHSKKTVAMSTRLPIKLWEVLQQLRLHFISLNRSNKYKKLPTTPHGITSFALKKLIDEYTMPTKGIMFYDPENKHNI